MLLLQLENEHNTTSSMFSFLLYFSIIFLYFVLFHFYLSLNYCFPSAYNFSAAGTNKDLSYSYIRFASIFLREAGLMCINSGISFLSLLYAVIPTTTETHLLN